jgi:hypothetical protein
MKTPAGSSGVGRVAVGVVFPSGKVVLEWLGSHNTLGIYDDLGRVEHIHGHGGKTWIAFSTRGAIPYRALIRALIEADLPQAALICRDAFGTFLGAPDPENFWADRDYVYGRFGAEHVASFAAEQDDELIDRAQASRKAQRTVGV